MSLYDNSKKYTILNVKIAFTPTPQTRPPKFSHELIRQKRVQAVYWAVYASNYIMCKDTHSAHASSATTFPTRFLTGF